jgi:hypothetical protein
VRLRIGGVAFRSPGTPRWRRSIGYDTEVDPVSIDAELRRLVDDYRTSCLWFLREDYYPETVPECDRVLSWISRHGDVQAFQRVAEVRRWLSRGSSETSAGC